jgi:Ca-activated chloride channel family protein
VTLTGLSFSQVLTLFGGLAAATVLLYLLKLRRRRVEVPFSALWARVVEDRKSSSLFGALKRFFSLLVQLMILALIVLALGNPELGGLTACNYEKAAPPPKRHTLILLDASASMATIEKGETRVARARAKAQSILDSFKDNPNHRAMIVQVDSRVRPLSLWSAKRKDLVASLAAYATNGALDTPTNAQDAVRVAKSAILGKENPSTVFITDRAFQPIAEDDVNALNLKVIPIGKEGVNVGISAFNVRPYLDDSLSYAIFYALRNDSEKELKATLYLYANEEGRSEEDFTQDANLVGGYQITLPPKTTTKQVIDNVSFTGSRLAAKIEVADPNIRDVFARDDVAFALVPERRKLNVQLVTKGNLFLHATLFLRENVAFEVVKPAQYRGPDGYDITVVDGVDVDMSQPGSYFVLNPQPSDTFRRTGTATEPETHRVRRNHPIGRNLKLVDLNITEASKFKRMRGDVTVVSGKRGLPLVFTRSDREGKRRFAVIAFDIRKSLLPLNYSFPLMVVNVFNWFYQEKDALLQPNRAGIELSLPLDIKGQKLTVKGPSTVRARRIDTRVHLSADRIGIYELASPSSNETQAIAINLMNDAESQLKPLGKYAAWQAPPPYIKKEDALLDHLWRLLLMIALGIVTLEWLTYHRRITV